jgi:hypothetical protein
MSFTLAASLSAIGLFFGMLVLFEAGRRIGKHGLGRDSDGVAKGTGPAEAAVFGLLGLLLAFTFSGAASRFEARRHLVTEEANAIGTAYLRIDLLPRDMQPEMRQLFRRYLDARIAIYRQAQDATDRRARLAEIAALQNKMWATAIAASPGDTAGHVARVLLPALNQLIDITTTRATATQNHPPRIIFILLASLCLVSAALVGYITCTTARRNWFSMLILAISMSLTFYVILDLENPRLGLIRIDGADQVLITLRESIR